MIAQVLSCGEFQRCFNIAFTCTVSQLVTVRASVPAFSVGNVIGSNRKNSLMKHPYQEFYRPANELDLLYVVCFFSLLE